MFNRTAAVFVEFELLYYRAWIREVTQLQYGKSSVKKYLLDILQTNYYVWLLFASHTTII